MEEKKRPVVIRTIVHLTDIKGWKAEEEHPGDFHCGSMYRMGKRVRYGDAPFPIGKFAEVDYQAMDALKSMYYEFDLEMERYEPIFENYYFKHLYFEER